MPTFHHPNFPSVSRVEAPVTLVVAALLCLLLVVGYFLRIGYQYAMVAAETETRNLVGVIESRLSSEFSRVDGMLTFIASEVQSSPFQSRSAAVSAEKTQNLVRMVKSFPQLAGLFAFDAEGRLQMTSDPSVKSFSIADQPHFKNLRDHPQASLDFSEPILSHTGKWSLIQSLAIRDDAGRFLGAVSAVHHIDTFSDLFRSTDVGQTGGSILLRRSDNFQLIARIPVPNENDFNRPIPEDYPVRQRLESGVKQGTLAFTANTDGVRRIGSFARLDDRFPFYVQVALSEDHYFAEWHQQVFWTGLVVVPLLLAFGVAVLRLRFNITMRKHAEERERQREAERDRESKKNKALLQNASDGIVILDENANVLEVSDSYCTMLGYSRDEMIGMNLTNWDCGFSSPAELMKVFRQRWLSDARTQLQSLSRRKDGSLYDVEVHATRVDLDGVSVLYCSHRDITDRVQTLKLLKQQFKALKLSEAQVAISQQIAGTGSFVYDFNTDIVWASTQMLRMFGLPANVTDIPLDDFLACLPQHRDLVRQTLAGKYGFPTDLSGYQLDDILAGVSEHDPSHQNLADLINQSHEYDAEFTLQPAFGLPPKVIHAIGKLERDRDGIPIKILGSVQDVTERRKMEDALREARIAADAANISKSQFLATMSHEIRTPMNGILGMAQLLLMPDLTANERLLYSRTVLSSGQTLLALLNDILDLSKIEAGKIQLDTLVFEPDSVLSETHLLFSGAAQAKGLQLEHRWHGAPGHRYVSDTNRLRQMLSNLVGNALKFTQQGSVRMECAPIESAGQSALLEFSVSDTGMGILPDKIDLLFKPFSQTDSSITREFGGSGLGLSIVCHLARLMGGDVGVESVFGQGSRFWFRLKAQQVEGREEGRSSERPMPACDVTGSALRSGRVLVVEDNIVNRMVIESMLTKLGITVTLAFDGQQALDALAQGDRPDMILMDLHMPVMDGYDATERIRLSEQGNKLPHLPIIALTADAYEEDRQRCLAVGMDDFLTKPIALDTLQSALQKWLPMPKS